VIISGTDNVTIDDLGNSTPILNKRGDPTHNDSYMTMAVTGSYVIRGTSTFYKAKYSRLPREEVLEDQGLSSKKNFNKIIKANCFSWLFFVSNSLKELLNLTQRFSD